MWRSLLLGALLILATILPAGCGDDDSSPAVDAGPSDAGAPEPDAWVERPPADEQLCPGTTGCAEGSNGELFAGAAALEITPVGFETFTDVNGDAIWQSSEPFEDLDGDERFDAAWIAGFGNGRAAQGVMNPQWARALVLRNGDVTIAFVALDVVGWFLDENLLIREQVARAGLDVDYVVVSATHVHQARDTIGIWGPSLSETGISEDYQRYVRDQSVAAIEAALSSMQRANVQYADVRLRDVGDVRRWVGDNRDPDIVDDELRMLRFVEHGTADPATPGSGTTIATLINFASHPEYQGSRNPRLSSDWPHWMREVIEHGVEEGPEGTPIDGVGGVAVFVNGALGSQIGPNELRVERWDGTPVDGSDRDLRTEIVGTQLGVIALDALRGEGTTLEESADLAFHRLQVYVTVENRRYQIAYEAGVFVRALYHFDETRPVGERYGNLPDVLTEIALIDVGRATMLTAPGELDPAELVGGYEPPCDYTPGGCEALIDEDDVNPPDLSRAPSPPFLRDRLLARRPDAEQVWLLGLTNDFLGYFVPEFDYQLGAGLPYIEEAPGDHYEETNSIGIGGWPRIRRWMIELIEGPPRGP